MKVALRIICLMLMVVAAQFHAQASHILGADFSYRLVDEGESIYEVTLILYQDCLYGEPQAIAQDNPAHITIYTGGLGTTPGRSAFITDRVSFIESSVVPTGFVNECINDAPATCLKKTIFQRRYKLPASDIGYTITYQRCCRSGQINNIVNPDGIGATYFCTIPPTPYAKNNSPVFTKDPPQIICSNIPLVYDNGATDIDGDSLSYEFGTAYEGGNPSNPLPDPVPPPYRGVNYSSGYSAQRPLLSNPLLRINPTTGLISGTPSGQQKSVVTVVVKEWRNRVLINETRREFLFIVTNCSKAVVANIPQYSDEFNTYIVQCKSLTVKFDNLSTGGINYAWDFGITNSGTDVSSDFSPTFTYPDTGTYIVKLAVNRGSTCADSISRIVKVYPNFDGAFNSSGLLCPNAPIQFTDQSRSRYGPVSFWQWTFGDGQVSRAQDPATTYAQGGEYDVVLVSGNNFGCRDTVRKQLVIERFRPFAGNDTIIVRGETIQFRATGGNSYSWTPAVYLNSTTVANPIGYYPTADSVRYTVFVQSEVGCTGTDDILVWVVNQPALFVPNAFTPNGDGTNDILRPIAIGYRNFRFFRIFNRFGQMVYSTENIGEGWDGNYGGRPAELGVYFWVLATTDRLGAESQVKGDVTLLR